MKSTVSKVLEDMKKKYDAANRQSAQAQSQQNKSKSDLDMIKQVQKAKLGEIKKLCRYPQIPQVSGQLFVQLTQTILVFITSILLCLSLACWCEQQHVQMLSLRFNVTVALDCFRGVRDICSSFNLTDELSTVAASLKAEAKMLTSSKARADADDTIEDLLAFIDRLSSDQPTSSQKGIALNL